MSKIRDALRNAGHTPGPVGLGRITRLLYRDGDLCALCQKSMWSVDKQRLDATVDHIIPWSHGGSNAQKNLRLAHGLCNGKRGTTNCLRCLEGTCTKNRRFNKDQLLQKKKCAVWHTFMSTKGLEVKEWESKMREHLAERLRLEDRP